MASKTQLVLLLGSSGQVGRELVRTWPAEYLLAKSRQALDIRNLDDVYSAVNMLKPGVVINTASITDVISGQSDPELCWSVNAAGAMNVAKICAFTGTPLIQLSCSEVFGNVQGSLMLKELDVTGPSGFLGSSKLAGEQAVMSVAQSEATVARSGFRWWILRSSMLFGRPGGVRPHFVDRLMRASDPSREVMSPSDIIRSPTYVPHLIKEIVWLTENMRRVPNGVYHVCCKGAASFRDVASYTASVANRRVYWRNAARSELAKCLGVDSIVYPHNGSLDVSCWESMSGRSMPYWKQGVDAYLKSYARRE